MTFDSNSVNELLDKKNSEHFQTEYPIFFKTRFRKDNNKSKFFYLSPIDLAMKNNQISAIRSIISYMIKYQNNFVTSFMFQNNF